MRGVILAAALVLGTAAAALGNCGCGAVGCDCPAATAPAVGCHGAEAGCHARHIRTPVRTSIHWLGKRIADRPRLCGCHR